MLGTAPAVIIEELSTRGWWIVNFIPMLTGTLSRDVGRILATDVDEGTTWARGWNTKAANALRTVAALRE